MKKLSIVLLVLALGLGLAGEALAQKKKGADKKAAPIKNEQYVPDSLRDILEFQQKVDGEWAQYMMRDDAKVAPENMEDITKKISEATFEFPSIVAVFFFTPKDGAQTGYVILKNNNKIESKSFIMTKENKNEMLFDLMVTGDYITTPEQIYIEYANNILAAENKYKDFYFAVLSTVNRISKNPKGGYFIELNASTPVQNTVIYNLSKEQEESAGQLKHGDAIVVEASLEKCDEKGVVLKGGGLLIVKVPDSRLDLMPKPATQASAGQLKVNPPSQSAIDGMPDFDIKEYCYQFSQRGHGSSQVEALCRETEERAKAKISKMSYSEKSMIYCKEFAGRGHGSYSVLELCLDGEKEAEDSLK